MVAEFVHPYHKREPVKSGQVDAEETLKYRIREMMRCSADSGEQPLVVGAIAASC